MYLEKKDSSILNYTEQKQKYLVLGGSFCLIAQFVGMQCWRYEYVYLLNCKLRNFSCRWRQIVGRRLDGAKSYPDGSKIFKGS